MRLLPGAGLLLASVAALDAGDPESTDRRLLRAGAGTGLRLQTLEAVARGSAWLEGRQRADGTFLPPGARTWYAGAETVPVDALCAYALEVAGSPSGRAAAGRTLERLAPGPGRIPEAVLRHVHTASWTARLAAERRADPQVIAALGRALVAAQDEATGLWFPREFHSPPAFGTLVQAPAGKPVPDLETTHVALLGLAAAERAGGRAPAAIWSRALAGLRRLRGADGGWANGIGTAVSDLASAARAAASLVLARDSMLRRGPLPLEARLEFAGALDRGRGFLGEEAADAIWVRRRFPSVEAGTTFLLCDLETGLSFAGEVPVDGTPAYEAIATVLLDAQARDGRWDGGGAHDDLPATAFALLALARASETLRDDPGPPPAAIPEPSWPEEGAPPPSTAVPRREADEALEWLESLLDDPRAPPESLRRTLLFLGRAFARPGEGMDDPWRARAEAAFLGALDGPEGVLAARLLGRSRPRVSPALRRALHADRPVPVLREGFAALARLGEADSLAFLCGENLSTDDSGPRFERSRAALAAIPRFPSLPGPARRAAVGRILQKYEGIESAASPYALVGRGKWDPTSRSRWIACRRFVLDAVRALARDPVSGEFPTDGIGGRITTLAGFRQWLQDHADPAKAPWADR